MGWLWSNTSQDKPKNSHSAREEAQPIHPTSENASNPPSPTVGAPQTRDQQADAELQQLLKELNYAPSDYPPESIRPPPPTSSKQSSWTTSGPLRPSTSSPIDPVRMLPTKMSCRAAFDQAYHCQLPGGQLASVYRYGTMRNCSELWSNFWFCMRTNRGFMSEDERAERIRRHYLERESKYRAGPSSRDVWELRRDMEEGAFQGEWKDVDREMAAQWKEKEAHDKKLAEEEHLMHSIER